MTQHRFVLTESRGHNGHVHITVRVGPAAPDAPLHLAGHLSLTASEWAALRAELSPGLSSAVVSLVTSRAGARE